MTGVSFVVPVHNGAAHLAETLASIAAQADGRPLEIIVIDDGSTDGSAALLKTLSALYPLMVIGGPRRGAAAAVNAGIRAASHPVICQVDQDVVLERGWMATLVDAISDPSIGAAQGYYTTDPTGSLLQRVMALDLEQRYAAIAGDPDHVCTGNTAYRADALEAVGALDESLGYGYDNDLSYRLRAAGYRLALCRTARSRHHWRDGLTGYAQQQYGLGYGRLDVVARHPSRFAGDAVSPPAMMAHPAVMTAAVLLCVAGAVGTGVALLLLLALERTVAGVRAWNRFGDPAALAFPLAHLVRDAAWVVATAVWMGRRVLRKPIRPEHSMSGRSAAV